VASTGEDTSVHLRKIIVARIEDKTASHADRNADRVVIELD
jgi:hypothetical protein